MKTKSLVQIAALGLVVALAPIAGAQDNEDQGGPGGRRAHWQQKLTNLTPQERDQLRAAHQKAMQDPAVRSAQMKMRQAHREYRDAMRASMLKADPTIQPVLNKIPEGRMGRDS
jgi:Spy/CpxP family protein refolding chaperone